MKSVEFQKFIDLVTFDQNLVELERSIARDQDTIEKLLTKISRAQDAFSHIKTSKYNALKSVHEKELAMKLLDEKEHKIRQRLEAVHNQREYRAVEKELLQLQSDRLVQEQELLQLWNQKENLEQNFTDQQKDQDDMVGDLEKEIEILNTHIKKLQDDYDALQHDRSEKVHGVPDEWLHMYATMQGKVCDPVVKVVKNACDACFYMVTPRDIQRLKQNKLLQCKDCYRLLYYDNAE